MKILASIVYAVGVIFAGILLWWLVLGCAGTQVKNPSPGSQQSGWIAVAEISLEDWSKLSVEERGEVIVIIMKTYLDRTECYRANLGIVQRNKKLIFFIKCIEKMAGIGDDGGVT